MAMIKKFKLASLARPTRHDGIEASYASFQHDDGPILQVNTCGRATREQPGKQSQTLQFDRVSGLEFAEILQRTFG